MARRVGIATAGESQAQGQRIRGVHEHERGEFAVENGVPYAIDFLNPAPDFERERITDFYFRNVVEKMAHLVIDRALNGDPSKSWPRWEEMLGIGAVSGFTGAPAADSNY